VNPETQFYSFMSLNYLSGGLAGGVSLCFVYPLDLIRTRLAADVVIEGGCRVGAREFKGVVDCGRRIYGRAGVRGLYCGFGVS
jgi:solute carrier family 25 (adenine nucleotide translocator) protein 4/5/6/31